MIPSSRNPAVLASTAPTPAEARPSVSVADAHLPNAAPSFGAGPTTQPAETPAGQLARLIRPVVNRTSPAARIVPLILEPIPRSVHLIAPAIHFLPQAVHFLPPLVQFAAGAVQIVPPVVTTVPLDVITAPLAVITAPPAVITVPPRVIAAPQAVHRASTRAAMTRFPFAKTLFTNYLLTSSRSSLVTGGSVRILRCLITSARFAVLCDVALSTVSRTVNTQYSTEKHFHNSASSRDKARRPSLLLWLLPTAGRRVSHHINVCLTERKHQ
jgi:hypothetical protein